MSDDWDFYFLQVESCPASIFVDLGVRNDAPIASLAEMTWLLEDSRGSPADSIGERETSDCVGQLHRLPADEEST